MYVKINMENTELRHAPIEGLQAIARILEEGKHWKKLMENIPKDLNVSLCENFIPKYNVEDIRTIENEGNKQMRNCAEILFEEWGTSGIVRPTLGNLRDILVKAELIRAANVVSVDILKGPLVKGIGRAATIDISFSGLQISGAVTKNEIEERLNNMEYPESIPNLQTFNQNIEFNLRKPIPEKNAPIPLLIEPDEQGRSIAQNTESSVNNVTNHFMDNEIAYNENYHPALSMLMNNSPEIPQKIESKSGSESLMRTENNSVTDGTNSIISDKYLYENKYDTPHESNNDIPNSMSGNGLGYNIPNFSAIRNPTENIVSYKHNTKLPHFNFETIAEITNYFDRDASESNKCKIGSGGFGDVYVAKGLFEYPVAVKKLKSMVALNDNFELKQFKAEIEIISKYKHENLVSLLGYSCDTTNYCIIYEYVDGDTLRDHIAKNQSGPKTRTNIALGTAEGISYLHNGFDSFIIHRDITSANILLTKSLTPKLGDFGLIRTASDRNKTSNILGTSAYMAPEACRGDISLEMDIFSFGVVLLELLTGLPAYDKNRDGVDIVTHVEEMCKDGSINILLDVRNGQWMYADKIYELVKQCLSSKKNRPKIITIVNVLRDINNQIVSI